MPKASADRFREDAALIRSLHERKASKREREIVQRHVSGHVMVEYTTWFNMREWLSLAEKRLSLEAQEETRQTIALMQDAILNTDWKDVL
jgi:Trm5-related predicted tRNA methylase